MPVENHLLPAEAITFHAANRITFGQSKYDAYLTSQRLVLYARRGWLGRDDVVSWKLNQISQVQYQEKGIFTKTGVLVLAANNSRVDITGPAADMKQLYQQVLAAAHRDQA